MPNWLRTFGHPVPVSSTFPDGYGISSSQRSLIVSILSAGTFFGPFYHPVILPSSDYGYLGALSAAPIADSIGRKWGLVVACLVFSLGVVLQTAATALPPFITGRAFAGLGVGMVSTMVPMYQSECSPKWIRGAIVGLYQWGVTVGLLLAAIFNNITKNRPNHSSYRIPIGIQFIWAVILATGMTVLPEVCVLSPHFALEFHASKMTPVTSLADQEPS
jgi:MFS transporter, SP family, sugar:H+ symporter